MDSIHRQNAKDFAYGAKCGEACIKEGQFTQGQIAGAYVDAQINFSEHCRRLGCGHNWLRGFSTALYQALKVT